jgi:hypothetical protein
VFIYFGAGVHTVRMGQMKLKNCADQRTVVCGFREMSYRSRFGILMPTFYKGSTSLRGHSRRLETIRKSPLNGKFLSA